MNNWNPPCGEIPNDCPQNCEACEYALRNDPPPQGAADPCPTCEGVGGFCGGSGHPSCGCFANGGEPISAVEFDRRFGTAPRFDFTT